MGKKGGHIPYRDSKLTRILQLSLGGNARTAIICIMSPALTHVEQSRNTLSFATRAKEVTNNAQVNMVTPDKQLVKYLQKEVARLEAELHIPGSSNSLLSKELLMDKELKIKKLEMEMEELKRERNFVQSKLKTLQKKVNETGCNPCNSPHFIAKCFTFNGVSPINKEWEFTTANQTINTMRQSSTVPLMLVREIRKLELLQEQLGEEANRALEVLHEEVSCQKFGNQNAVNTIAKLLAEIRKMHDIRPLKEVESRAVIQSSGANLKEEITRLHYQGNIITDLEEQLENVQKFIDRLIMSLTINNKKGDCTKSLNNQQKDKEMLPLALISSISQQNFARYPCSPDMSSRTILDRDVENMDPNMDNVVIVSDHVEENSEKATSNKPEDGGGVSSRETSCHRRSSSTNMRKMQKMFQNATEENIISIKAYVTELEERVDKLQYQKQLFVYQVLELEANDATAHGLEEDDEVVIFDLKKSPQAWQSIFREQKQQIINYPAEQIYMEVELRRLSWLQKHFADAGNEECPAQLGDEPTMSLSSSIRSLECERIFLSKQMNSQFTEMDRDMLYYKWQIPIDAKQRRLKLACKLWTDPNDPLHIEESAQLVAKLVGFCEGGGNMSREMFELNFALRPHKKPWLLGWNQIANLLEI